MTEESKKADELRSAADKLAEDTVTAALKVADEKRSADAIVANQKIASDAAVAESVRKTEFYKAFYLPIALAIILGLQVLGLAWINGVHHLTNSMKDELVREVRINSRAEGIIEGKAQQKTTEQP